MRFLLTISILSILLLSACKKTSTGSVDNPYDKVKPPVIINPDKDKIPDPASIEGLHRNLFAPTCANSGCHDGSFEPDFRTVQSTFYSLVNQPPIKNDQAGTFSARVVPGDDNGSILIYRMTVDLGGNSGIMPIVLDPGSDYNIKKDEHLANLRKWINDGAKDIDGKAPQNVDFPPTILGVQALVGATPLPRGGKYEPLYSSAGQNFEIWFSLSDDKVAQGALSGMKINWSTDPTNYNPANEQMLTKATVKLMPGLYSSSAEYGWYYSFNSAGFKKDDVIWFRITMSDGTNTDYQLPNKNSMFFLKKYFAVKIN